MMCTILQGLKGVQCYLDDVIIFGSTQHEHDENLKAVLQKILKLNAEKCCLQQTKLQFLGYTLSPEGVLPDDTHITMILKAPTPNDAGLTAWYSKFVPNYASVVEPLRALLRKDNAFSWPTTAQVSFDKVKHMIVNSSALALFDPRLQIIFSTDALHYGLNRLLHSLHEAC